MIYSNYFSDKAHQATALSKRHFGVGNLDASWKATGPARFYHACDAITNLFLTIPSTVKVAIGAADAIYHWGNREPARLNRGCRELKTNVNRVFISTLGIVATYWADDHRNEDYCLKAKRILPYLRPSHFSFPIPYTRGWVTVPNRLF